MPSDPTWEETTSAEPSWEDTAALSTQTEFPTQQQPPRTGLERAAQNWQLGPLARAAQGPPLRPVDQSIFGISPTIVPSGANTRFPALTIPLSVAGKTTASALGYATSPQGVGEMVAAATPAAPVVFAKWAYDMSRSGYNNVKDMVQELGGMARDAFNRGIINANNLGPIPEGTTTQEHVQSLLEKAANAALMGTGAIRAASHIKLPTREIKTVPGSARTELQPSVELPPAPKLSGEAREFQILRENWLPTIKPWRRELLDEEVAKGEGTSLNNIETNFEDSPGARDVERAKRYYELARKLFGRQPVETPPTSSVGEATPSAPAESEAKVSGEPAPAVKPSQPIVTPSGPQMGAAGITEIPETGAGGEKYGVAERVRAERAQAGQVEPVEPGQGMSTQQTIEMGRDIIRRDPEAGDRIMADFEADPDKKISATGIAVVRAHGESLAAGARTIEDNLGTESSQYKAAKNFLSDWDRRSKAMQTEWHKQGMAQQGETDIDTGSFTGLERARKQASGKDFTQEQKPKATKIAADNKQAIDAVNDASGKLNEQIADTATNRGSDDPRTKVWASAKSYLDENKGIYKFDDLRHKVAADLNMPVDEVTKILASDKTTRKLAADLWGKQRNARRLKEQAKNWLRELDRPGYQKALASIPNAMFSLSVFGHGFVALGTHAPIVAFQPRFWNAYVRNFGKMYKMVFSPAYYEQQMQDLVRRPNYDVARQSGLQNDPFKYEEFHTTQIRDVVSGWIGPKNMDRVDKLASAGNRGYSVLKVLRQDMWDQKYDNLPKSIRSQEGVPNALSNDVNHSTGVTAKSAFKGANVLAFAPRLMGSRFMWVGGDPVKAGATILNWKNASTADKLFATNQMKEKAWVFGTFASLLAANQGFLSASGSKQKINGIPEVMGGAGFDPLSGDFLKFKVHGADIAYGGALLTLCKMPVRVGYAIAFEGKGSKYVLEDERSWNVLGKYIRTQMSPFAGTISDLAFGRDFEERPLPTKLFGTMEQEGAVPKRLQEQGVDEPYTWKEYAATKLPIPIAEALREGFKGSGMPDEQMDYWMKAFGIGIIMMGTGTRITEDTREE